MSLVAYIKNQTFDSFSLDSIRCQHPSYHVLLQKLMDEEEACNNFLYNRVKVIPRIHRVFFFNLQYRMVSQLALFGKEIPNVVMS